MTREFPGKQEKLFKRVQGCGTNVSLRWLASIGMDAACIRGFKDAADRIVDSLPGDRRHPDDKVFPVAYLYRHYLELKLKYVIKRGMSLDLIEITNERKFFNEHRLRVLWEKAKKVISDAYPDSPRDQLQYVEKLILEFDHVDQNGQEFRYAESLDGERHLQRAPESFSLANLKETMDKVHYFLDSCCTGMDAWFSSLCENAEYG